MLKEKSPTCFQNILCPDLLQVEVQANQVSSNAVLQNLETAEDLIKILHHG